MGALLTIIYALLGFVILVFFHELGHFIFAKIGKVGVDEFAVGMGKALWQKRYKKTLYSIRMLPIGGYCKLKGHDDFGPVKVTAEPDNFFSRPPYIRFLVSFGGPFFSYLLGLILLSFVFFSQGEMRLKYTKISTSPNNSYFMDGDEILKVNGQKVQYWREIETQMIKNNGKKIDLVLKRNGKEVKIKDYIYKFGSADFTQFGHGDVQALEVIKDSAADKAGIQSGDIILSINNHVVKDEKDLLYWVQNSKQLPLKFKIKRYQNWVSRLVEDDLLKAGIKDIPGIKIIQKDIIPNVKNSKKIVGVYMYLARDLSPYAMKVQYGFHKAVSRAFSQSFDVIFLSFKGIVQMIKGEAEVKNVAGPLRIFKKLGEAGSEGGVFSFLSFAGIISLALAFFNFIPFPALDGGHMLLALIEIVTGKKVNAKVMTVVQIIGIFFLLGMLLLVSINDISGWVSGWFN